MQAGHGRRYQMVVAFLALGALGGLWLSGLASASTSSQIPTLSFHTQSFHPPQVRFTANPDSGAGDVFLTPRDCCGSAKGFQRGPMIMDSLGHLVWFRPVPGMANNLQVQTYQGQPVLTWWQGDASNGGNGEDVIVDRSYRTVAVVHAVGCSADMHEFQITSQGMAIVDCMEAVPANLSSVGGRSNGHAWDSVIQEIDIKTGKLLWEWRASYHVSVSSSYERASSKYSDYFHLNSVQLLPNGNLLVSARNTWAIYEISRQTKNVIWTLGGKHSSFKFGSGAAFEWQHDAQLNGNRLSLFDDADSPQEESQSSAEVLKLNTSSHPMTATLIARYRHSPPVLSPAQGSTQLLSNGNVFVGWGSDPQFSEFNSSGRQIFNGSFPLGLNSYRAYRFQWNPQPVDSPAIAVSKPASGKVKVYASWNGANNVASWRVMGGSSSTALNKLAQVPNSSFEATITVNDQPYLQVQALDSHGNVLKTSSTVSG